MDLPAEMEQERPVGDVLDLDPVDRAARANDRVGMFRVRREDGDVANLAARLRANEIDRVEQPARVGDRPGEIGKGSSPVLETDAQCEGERCGRVGDVASLSLTKSVEFG